MTENLFRYLEELSIEIEHCYERLRETGCENLDERSGKIRSKITHIDELMEVQSKQIAEIFMLINSINVKQSINTELMTILEAKHAHINASLEDVSLSLMSVTSSSEKLDEELRDLRSSLTILHEQNEETIDCIKSLYEQLLFTNEQTLQVQDDWMQTEKFMYDLSQEYSEGNLKVKDLRMEESRLRTKTVSVNNLHNAISIEVNDLENVLDSLQREYHKKQSELDTSLMNLREQQEQCETAEELVQQHQQKVLDISTNIESLQQQNASLKEELDHLASTNTSHVMLQTAENECSHAEEETVSLDSQITKNREVSEELDPIITKTEEQLASITQSLREENETKEQLGYIRMLRRSMLSCQSSNKDSKTKKLEAQVEVLEHQLACMKSNNTVRQSPTKPTLCPTPKIRKRSIAGSPSMMPIMPSKLFPSYSISRVTNES